MHASVSYPNTPAPPMTSWLARVVVAFLAWPASWPGMLVRTLHRIAMLDRRLLARCAKQEQGVYTYKAALMLLAALWAGHGMGSRLAAYAGGGVVAELGAFCFFFAFALSMEGVIIGTIKPRMKILRTVGIRMILGGCLILMQVLPSLTWMFAARIELRLHQQALGAIAEARGVSTAARDLTALQSRATELMARADVARSQLQEPPDTAHLRQLAGERDAARAALDRAGTELEAARRRASALRNQLAAPQLTDAARPRIEKALQDAQAVLARRQDAFSKADVALQNAETAIQVARRTQAEELRAAVAQAVAAEDEHRVVLGAAQASSREDASRTEALARRAYAPSFMTELGAFFTLMRDDVTVLLVSVFVFMVAAMIDLLATFTKVALRDGPYAAAVAAEEEMLLMDLDVQLAQRHAVYIDAVLAAAETVLARAAQTAQAAPPGTGIREFVEAQLRKLVQRLARRGPAVGAA